MADAPGQTNPPREPGLGDYAAVGLAWLVPGLGHILIGQRARGVIFLITIHLLFAAGLFIGGIRAINPSDQPIWSVTQFLAGWPMLLANKEQQLLTTAQAAAQAAHQDLEIMPLDYTPGVRDVGSVYCGIAGMLNMLVMFDILLRVVGGQRPSTVEELPSPPANNSSPSPSTGAGA